MEERVQRAIERLTIFRAVRMVALVALSLAFVAAVLERLIDQLPENQRAALQLHRSEDFSYQKIADTLQVSTMAFASRS